MKTQTSKKLLPLVYACSGCSSAAQLANDLALHLDRNGLAEMSCIAGIGGKVAPLLKTAHSGRTIIALDGCLLCCVKETLAQEHITPSIHLDLSSHGIKKRRRDQYSEIEWKKALDMIENAISKHSMEH